MVKEAGTLSYALVPESLSLRALVQDDPVITEAVEKAIKRNGLTEIPSLDKVQAEIYHRGNTTVTLLTVYPPAAKKIYSEPFLRGVGTAKRNPIDQYSSTIGWIISMTRALKDLAQEIRILTLVNGKGSK